MPGGKQPAVFGGVRISRRGGRVPGVLPPACPYPAPRCSHIALCTLSAPCGVGCTDECPADEFPAVFPLMSDHNARQGGSGRGPGGIIGSGMRAREMRVADPRAASGSRDHTLGSLTVEPALILASEFRWKILCCMWNGMAWEDRGQWVLLECACCMGSWLCQGRCNIANCARVPVRVGVWATTRQWPSGIPNWATRPS
ncbi:hypothetical protein BV25DRAFT_679859 [Artomyces pyxidatus]|uniref:Uncharacterized protein n=1 Tax=Artomyces pyxidatus TaxID=48021 RepID=A0ACB8T2I9_9AGAM|nr:hypothetical protein BV25DRAFT_679859 [Artomyces pyxidatus]